MLSLSVHNPGYFLPVVMPGVSCELFGVEEPDALSLSVHNPGYFLPVVMPGVSCELFGVEEHVALSLSLSLSTTLGYFLACSDARCQL